MSTNQVNAPEVTAAALSGQDDAIVASSAGVTRYAHAEQEADPADVAQIAGPGSGFCIRVNWGNRHGQWVLSYAHPSINARSRVFVAVSEGAAGGPDAGKFIGAARYTVHNVAPRAGGVDIMVDIDWNTNILLYADYFVCNP